MGVQSPSDRFVVSRDQRRESSVGSEPNGAVKGGLRSDLVNIPALLTPREVEFVGLVGPEASQE